MTQLKYLKQLPVKAFLITRKLRSLDKAPAVTMLPS